jgi:hypothetical protein
MEVLISNLSWELLETSQKLMLVFIIYTICLKDLEHQSSISPYRFTSVLHRTAYSLLILLLHDVRHIKLQM